MGLNVSNVLSKVPCDESSQQKWNNCFGYYEYDNGDTFQGVFMNDFPSNGTYTYPDGDLYNGNFNLNGERHGFGTYKWRDGEKYIGNWKNGIKDGDGTSYFINNEKFIGKFKNNSFKYGTYYYNDGGKYTGEYQNDLAHGQGSYEYPEGDKYIGRFVNDLFHGFGRYVWGPNSKWAGDVFEGEYSYGNRNGKGTYIYSNGDKETGMWRNDEFLDTRQHNKNIIDENFSFGNDEILPAKSGTGFVVSNKGHIITNHHVIENCNQINVHNRNSVISSQVIALDKTNDLALLKANFTPSSILKLDEDGPELMEDIFVAGFPFGKDISSSVKITKGIVSSLTGIGNDNSIIQIDAAIQPGNSGGPILSQDGNVIGVAVAKLDMDDTMENYGVIPENTNFGIKVGIVKKLLTQKSINFKSAQRNIGTSKRQIAESLTNSTFYLSCLMTAQKIKELKERNVLFQELIE